MKNDKPCGGGLLTDAFVDFGEAEGFGGECQSVKSAESSFDFVIGERVEVLDTNDASGVVVEDVGHGEGGGGGVRDRIAHELDVLAALYACSAKGQDAFSLPEPTVIRADGDSGKAGCGVEGAVRVEVYCRRDFIRREGPASGQQPVDGAERGWVLSKTTGEGQEQDC